MDNVNLSVGETTQNISLLVCYSPDKEEILRLENNGDFFFRGNLIENDKKVVDAFRDFLSTQGFLK